MRSSVSAVTLLVGIGAVSSLAVASCTYDFDGAFSDSPGTTGTETGAVGGGGGVSPTGGSAGTTTSGGGGTGGVAGTGGVGGTGGDPGGEDCSNGTDDDGDQDIDCADTDCQQGWECAVEPPATWDGPFAVYVGPGGQASPSCGGSWDDFDDHGIGMVASGAQCSNCACSTPSLQCSLPDTTLFDANGCNPLDTVGTLTPTADGACIPFSSPYIEAVLLVESTDQGSSCTASGGVLSAPTISWNQALRICSGDLVLGGCGGQQVCAPQRDANFQRCITRTGVFACPAPYTARVEFYASYTDTRACSTCTCGAPASLVCDGYTELHDLPGCSGGPVETYDARNQCDGQDVTPIASGSFRYTATNSSGNCSTQGGQLSGSVSESGRTTLCCLP